MKNIGLLTTHSSMNFGGLLQAYALKQTINELGFNCEIINYVPETQNPRKNPVQFVIKRRNFFNKTIFALTHYQEYKSRNFMLYKYRNSFLSPQPLKSVSYELLPLEIEKYDAICCGSDQLWNLNLGDMANGAFMLNFPHQVRAFSYAVSFGDGLVTKEEETIKSLQYIRNFSHISVREKTAKTFLDKHHIESELCIDPTLLRTRDWWNSQVSDKIIDRPYLLIYGFDSAFQRYDDLIQGTKKIANTLGLEVVNILMAPQLARAGFQTIFNTGPNDFLNLIKNASYVCTNSFHACVFSYLFETPFSVIYNNELGIDDRKKTLLEMLELSDRFFSVNDIPDKEKLLHCKLSEETSIFNQKRKESFDYLAHAINGI